MRTVIKCKNCGVEEIIFDLSDREKEVLQLAATGLSNKEIGDLLFIHLTTVKAHMKNILNKLDAKNRTHAVYLSQLHGLIKAKEKELVSV